MVGEESGGGRGKTKRRGFSATVELLVRDDMVKLLFCVIVRVSVRG